MTDENKSIPRGVRRSARGRFSSALPGEVTGILVHLDRDLVSVLDARAAESGQSRSVLIRRLLKLALADGEHIEQQEVESNDASVPRVAIARSQTPQNTLPAPSKFRF